MKELKIFDSPKNVRIFLICFYAALAILLVIDFFIHKHPKFPWEGYPNFFAAFGFVSCVLLVYIAKLLRPLVKRGERYYEETGGKQ